MFIPTEFDSPRHIRRLEALGYTIVDISPPLVESASQPIASPELTTANG
jgi:CelD/BcsL family acetyltransferase involved in cellulose biosynthesis